MLGSTQLIAWFNYLLWGLPVTGIRGYEHLVPWLSKSKFEQLTFGQQVSLAGNGQCLPLMGSLAMLALFGADLTAERALAEAEGGREP